MPKLYSYFRSSAAYRVRIALELKGLDYRISPVHLLRDGGEQHSDSYKQLNPTELVPTFVDDDGTVINQSMAIIEYLDEKYTNTPLLPDLFADRARVRGIALQIACDIHPVNNLRILQYLARDLAIEKSQRDNWYRHWVIKGFSALEQQLQSAETGDFCHGDQPGLADCFLVPQVFNANRFEVDMGQYPAISRIVANCEGLSAFQNAHPDAQPDAA